MACSRLFRGGNQIAALLGGAEPQYDRKLILDQQEACMNGIAIFLTELNLSMNKLTKEQSERLKKEAVFKEFTAGLSTFNKEYATITADGLVNVRSNEEVMKDRDDVVAIVRTLVSKGMAVNKRCAELSQKCEIVAYSPTPTIEFPIVCGNQKAPEKIKQWVALEDKDLSDKRVLCDIDLSALSQVMAVAESLGITSAAVRQASEAVRASPFFDKQRLSNGFKVCIIEGSFIGVAKDVAEEIAIGVGGLFSWVPGTVVGSLFSAARYMARQALMLTSIPTSLINACVIKLESMMKNRYIEYQESVICKWRERNPNWSFIANTSVVAAGVLLGYYILSVPFIFNSVVEVGRLIFQYIFPSVTTTLDKVLKFGDTYRKTALAAPKLIQLLSIMVKRLVPENSKNWKYVHMLLNFLVRISTFFLNVYLFAAFGRDAVAGVSVVLGALPTTMINAMTATSGWILTPAAPPAAPPAPPPAPPVATVEQSAPPAPVVEAEQTVSSRTGVVGFQMKKLDDEKNMHLLLSSIPATMTKEQADKIIEIWHQIPEPDENTEPILNDVSRIASRYNVGCVLPDQSPEVSETGITCAEMYDPRIIQSDPADVNNVADDEVYYYARDTFDDDDANYEEIDGDKDSDKKNSGGDVVGTVATWGAAGTIIYFTLAVVFKTLAGRSVRG
jgi:hypothetical protein